jgi:hypothetical protein
MSGFEFYFSFYGLLLGLSVAEVANGFLNTVGARRSIRVGFLTPLLAVFIFLDIASFWLFAWGIRDSLSVSWGTMFTGLFVALSYFLAAGLVFPRQIAEWDDLDEHYWKHKRLVLVGVLMANAIVFGQPILLRSPSYSLSFWLAQASYWRVLIALLFSRLAKLDLLLLGVGIAGYLALPLFAMETAALGKG